jgi:hypothetical protein
MAIHSIYCNISVESIAATYISFDLQKADMHRIFKYIVPKFEGSHEPFKGRKEESPIAGGI